MNQLPKSFFAARNPTASRKSGLRRASPPRPPRWTSPPREGNLSLPCTGQGSFKTAALVLFVIPLFAAGCGAARVAHRPDAEIERSASAAKSAYAAGSVESASVFYQKALDRARLMDESWEVARMAYNLAACRAQMQKYNEALELLDEAQFECDQTGFELHEIRLLRAEIMRCLGQTSEALALATAGLEALKNQKNNPYVIQLQLLLAELACDRNDGKQALEELDKIDRRGLTACASIIQARTANVRGRALLINHRLSEAAIYFDNAAALYRKARRYSDMAKALQRAGNAYEAADKRQEAFNRHYRASRSLFLCGENIKAQESFNKAEKIAEELADKEMLSALARLKTEIGPDPENRISP